MAVKLLAPLFLIAMSLSAADPYWVSPTGVAAWAAAQSATPLSGTACASLITANANLTGGNTAYLRGGVYTNHIYPATSGATNSVISYVAHTGESPVISNSFQEIATYTHGIALIARSWIKVEGVTVWGHALLERPLQITQGASFNELSHCYIRGNKILAAISLWDGGSVPHPTGTPCLHNWIHDCIIADSGGMTWSGSAVNDSGGLQLGVTAYDYTSDYTTVENCEFYGGGHHNIETFTMFNVIRNNFFHFEGSMTNETGFFESNLKGPDSNGLWGNRNYQIYDGIDRDGVFNLLEGNRFGAAGPPPDDDGGDGLTITAPKNIIRYNTIYSACNNGVLFKEGFNSKSYTNRFYNNTIFANGRFQNTNSLWQGANIRWYGGYTNYGSVLKNNILYQYGGAAEMTALVANHENYSLLITNNWWTTNGNPLFVSPDVSNLASTNQPQLALQQRSLAIDAGIPLTLANGAGSASVTLIVDDALYFQDGTWGSALANHQPDKLAVGTLTNIVQISSIDYATQTIALSSSITWSDNDNVWLYSRNDGTLVLNGPAPDLGAFEYRFLAEGTVNSSQTTTHRRRGL